jgi:tetratricopeptide (TPR) repeat protein
MRWQLLAALAGLVVFCSPSEANDRTACLSAAHSDAAVAACTRLLSTGKLQGAELANVRHFRGFHYLGLRQYDPAIADFDAVIKLRPNYALAFSNRSLSYQGKGDHARAISDMSVALALEPNAFADRWYVRGDNHERRGQFSEALADYGAALKLDPKHKLSLDGVQRVKAKLSTAPAPVPAKPAERAPAAPRDRVALVIGIGAYKHAAPLANPSNDANDLAAALRKLGFDVIEGRDLDKRGVEDKLREFGRKLEGAKVALFFYAGHGMQVNGKNYLVPTDAKLERPGDLTLDTIETGIVLAQMEAEKRVNLIILDACRDNPLSRSLSRSLGTRSTSVGQGLAPIQSGVGTMIVYATQPDAVALDGTGRNSPFTTALLKHLPATGQDIAVVMRRVRADVISATNEKQVPWDHSSLIGDVVLAR